MLRSLLNINMKMWVKPLKILRSKIIEYSTQRPQRFIFFYGLCAYNTLFYACHRAPLQSIGLVM